MKDYKINITQTVYYYKTIVVKAENEEEAKKIARTKIEKMDLTNSTDFSSEIEIIDIDEVK